MMNPEDERTIGEDQALRRQAVVQLRNRRDFRLHACAYVLVNALLIGIWAVTGGPFWPIFPALGWGLGLLINAWVVFWRPAIDEDSIRSEVKRLRDQLPRR